jgi:predicted nucleotidyltransferase component of viral defense system
MLHKYKIESLKDAKNALKEITQEVILCGLSRARFFKKAAFHGGTALRIFYALRRFSEDLDFSLVLADLNFNLSHYLPFVENELCAIGLNFKAEPKTNPFNPAIASAFLTGNLKENLSLFYPNTRSLKAVHPEEVIKIKIDVDLNTPGFATFENKNKFFPSFYQIKLHDMPTLFAGKLHAVLCRAWKNRIKGRDLYDYIFYISQNSAVNMPYLKAKLVNSGFIDSNFDLVRTSLINLLNEHFTSVDIDLAKQDVLPFVTNSNELKHWNLQFFLDITKNINPTYPVY